MGHWPSTDWTSLASVLLPAHGRISELALIPSVPPFMMDTSAARLSNLSGFLNTMGYPPNLRWLTLSRTAIIDVSLLTLFTFAPTVRLTAMLRIKPTDNSWLNQDILTRFFDIQVYKKPQDLLPWHSHLSDLSIRRNHLADFQSLPLELQRAKS